MHSSIKVHGTGGHGDLYDPWALICCTNPGPWPFLERNGLYCLLTSCFRKDLRNQFIERDAFCAFYTHNFLAKFLDLILPTPFLESFAQ